MNIHEYQAKELLKRYGVAVPTATSPGRPTRLSRRPPSCPGRCTW